MILLLLSCGPTVLTDGFEAALSQGWACGSTFYIALDDAQRFRVQADTTDGVIDLPAEDEYFRVYTGASLIVETNGNPCDDVSRGPIYQRLDYVYEGTTGTVTFVEAAGEISLRTEGVQLRANNELLSDDEGAAGWEDLPAIDLGTVDFLAVGIID